jgi:hypothetical protein
MDIKMDVKTVLYCKIDDDEWNKFVREEWNNEDWNFMADEEASNDSLNTFEIDGKVNSYNERKLARFKVDCLSEDFMTKTLLNDLCRRGKISKGVYVITLDY